MRDTRSFQIGGDTTTVANATSATAAVIIPPNCDTVSLFNSSTTATTFVAVTQYLGPNAPAGDAPTTSAGYPIPPGGDKRVYVGIGGKVIRTIASAADGNIYITPGTGI